MKRHKYHYYYGQGHADVPYVLCHCSSPFLTCNQGDIFVKGLAEANTDTGPHKTHKQCQDRTTPSALSSKINKGLEE